MADPATPSVVRIFTAPEAACGAGMTWAAAVGFIRDRLGRRFSTGVAVEHIEVFSQRSFEFPAVLEAIQHGAALPIVQVEGEIVSQGGKLSESRIARAIEARGPTGAAEPRRE
jgi:hypothetical protein